MAREFSPKEVSIRCVGEIGREVEPTLANLPQTLDLIGKVAQHELPRHYAWADIFVFPTIHDGFAVVLTQALANGLPVLTTAHCSGPDLIEEGRTGWILPIRSPKAFIERIRWCLSNRHRLTVQLDLIQESYRARTWDDVALDFETLVMEGM